jgi:hypothetical protein
MLGVSTEREDTNMLQGGDAAALAMLESSASRHARSIDSTSIRVEATVVRTRVSHLVIPLIVGGSLSRHPLRCQTAADLDIEQVRIVSYVRPRTSYVHARCVIRRANGFDAGAKTAPVSSPASEPLLSQTTRAACASPSAMPHQLVVRNAAQPLQLAMPFTFGRSRTSPFIILFSSRRARELWRTMKGQCWIDLVRLCTTPASCLFSFHSSLFIYAFSMACHARQHSCEIRRWDL